MILKKGDITEIHHNELLPILLYVLKELEDNQILQFNLDNSWTKIYNNRTISFEKLISSIFREDVEKI